VGFASCKPADALVVISLEHFRVVIGFQVQVVVLYDRSNGDCLEGKRENYQVCSVQYCVQ